MTITNEVKWRPKLALFLISQAVSMTGSMVVAYAVMWYLTIETSSGAVMTGIVLCNCLPQICISPFAGVWADRYSRKRIVILADCFIALSTLILALVWLSGYKELWFVFLVMIVRSLGGGVQAPAVNALIPALTPFDQLTRVNAIYSTVNNVLALLAPALGGVLLALGLAPALFFDVATALLAVVIFSFIRVSPLVRSAATAGNSVLADFKAGMSYISANPWLRFLLIFYAVIFFLIAPASYLTPLMVEREFGPEIWRLTANEIIWSAGAALGGVVVAAWGGFRNRIFSIGFACLMFGLTFALMGGAQNFWFYLAVMGVSGLFLPLFVTAETTLLQEKTEEQMLGRVSSVMNIVVAGAMPLAMLIMGPLADMIDVRWIIGGSGLAMALCGAVMLMNKAWQAFDDRKITSQEK